MAAMPLKQPGNLQRGQAQEGLSLGEMRAVVHSFPGHHLASRGSHVFSEKLCTACTTVKAQGCQQRPVLFPRVVHELNS